jgi:hypothetical protein
MARGGPSRTPEALREGVREGVVAALGQTGAPAARRLLAAGAAGVLGSVGAVFLLAGHPFGHHPSWHLATFSCLWGALLVVAFALVWLRIRTPDWPLADGARVGLVALGLAGLAALLSPDPHVLHAWQETGVARWLAEIGGGIASALGLGLAVGLPASLLGAVSTPRRVHRRDRRLVAVAAGMVTLLLLPGIALQCVGEARGTFLGWLLATLLGSGAGIALGLGLRRRLGRPAETPAHERTDRR